MGGYILACTWAMTIGQSAKVTLEVKKCEGLLPTNPGVKTREYYYSGKREIDIRVRT